MDTIGTYICIILPSIWHKIHKVKHNIAPRYRDGLCMFHYVFYGIIPGLPLLHTAMPTPFLNTFWHSDPTYFYICLEHTAITRPKAKATSTALLSMYYNCTSLRHLAPECIRIAVINDLGNLHT